MLYYGWLLAVIFGIIGGKYIQNQAHANWKTQVINSGIESTIKVLLNLSNEILLSEAIEGNNMKNVSFKRADEFHAKLINAYSPQGIY